MFSIMNKIAQNWKFCALWPIVMEPQYDSIVNPERHRSRFILTVPSLIPFDQIGKKPGILNDLPSGRRNGISGCVAPCGSQPNQVRLGLAFNGCGFHAITQCHRAGKIASLFCVMACGWLDGRGKIRNGLNAAGELTMAFGFIAYDKKGFAIRAYVAKSAADAKRASEIELGPSLGKVCRFPLHVVNHPFENDKHLIPANITGNHGWSNLTPWDAAS
jgi:hypothetical protein